MKLIFSILALGLTISVMASATKGRIDPFDPASYVTFESNGGTGVMAVKRIKSARWMKLPNCLYRKKGYVFAGWCGACEDCSEESGGCWHVAGDKVYIQNDATYHAVWKKLWLERATSYCAYVLNCEGSVGALLFVKAGAPSSKTGLCAITATILQPNAKKITLKGKTDTGHVTLSGKKMTLELELSETSVSGALNGNSLYGSVVVARVSGTRVLNAVSLTAPVYDGGWLLLPQSVPVTITSSLWSLPMKSKLVVSDGNIDTCKIGENPCGAKLAYNGINGKITGTFTSYSGFGNGMTLVSKEKFTVTGVLVDGMGYGYAVSKAGHMCEFFIQY